MPGKDDIHDRIRRTLHKGHEIIEVDCGGCSVEESQAVIKAFAARLEGLRQGEKIRTLTNFQGAAYDPQLPLAWKSHLKLFGSHIERSAVIGVPPLGPTMLRGYAETAKLLGEPIGSERAVPFPSRAGALDWLAG